MDPEAWNELGKPTPVGLGGTGVSACGHRTTGVPVVCRRLITVGCSRRIVSGDAAGCGGR